MAPIFSKLCSCFKPVNQPERETSTETTNTPVVVEQHSIPAPPVPLERNLGHSFRYVKPSTLSDRFAYTPSSSLRFSPTRSDHPETAFTAISGASVSANNSNPKTVLQMQHIKNDNTTHEGGKGIKTVGGFKSTSSFRALPLHHAPARRDSLFLSGPLHVSGGNSGAGENGGAGDVSFSAPLGDIDPKKKPVTAFSRLRDACQRVISEGRNFPAMNFAGKRGSPVTGDGRVMEKGESSVQWAHGKAGEDRVHVVVPEKQGWMFVGIYDGFNGPDAPEFLVNNLYKAIYDELKGLFYEVEDNNVEEINLSMSEREINHEIFESQYGSRSRRRSLWDFLEDEDNRRQRSLEISSSKSFKLSMHEAISKLKNIGMSLKRKKSEKEKADDDEAGGEERSKKKVGPIDHDLVLSAMSRALEKTEGEYLEMTERLLESNAELALMGSCVLVVIMRDDDVYVMNVGDSRAVIAQYEIMADNKESLLEGNEGEITVEIEEHLRLVALQLSTDHSTSVEEEVMRIQNAHLDDNQCIVNHRVKGRLQVTRAFGAGFLKQPKLNDAVLEIFRAEYVGTAPYICCTPSLYHYRLSDNDRFLILSSDGLYQYLTNHEVVSLVENFMESFADGDPAQYLIEQLLLRAAQKAGMDVHELLDIPQGDRRKYHDDATVMVISLEGRIWKSSGNFL